MILKYVSLFVAFATSVNADGHLCIPEPYPDLEGGYATNLGAAVSCFQNELGDPGENGSLDGLWYSQISNDQETMEYNSEIPWGPTIGQLPPAIIARPYTEEQIATALQCSIKNGMRVVPWGKGHNWADLTALPNYVIIRLDNICYSSVDMDDYTMVVSAGCSAGHQVGQLRLFGEETKNRMVLNFGCPNMAVAGSFTGGGQGYSSGYVGLQIDAATNVRTMLYDENGDAYIVDANEDEYSDLFWAHRGGMGGYGIVLDITLQSVENPSPDAMSWIDMFFPIEARGYAWYRFQELLLSDRLFGIAQSCNFNTDGTQIRTSYIGPAEDAIEKLIDIGLIGDYIDTDGSYSQTPVQSFYVNNWELACAGDNCTEFDLPTRGVSVFQYPSFREYSAMGWYNPALANANEVCSDRYEFDCGIIEDDNFIGPNSTQGIDGQYYFLSQEENAALLLEMASDVDSDLNNPLSPFWQRVPASILHTPGHQWRLTEEGWERLAELRNDETCPVIWLFTHATGGIAAQVPVEDTAYPWRGFPLLSGWLGPFDTPECENFLNNMRDTRRDYAVDGLGSGGGYINYPGDQENCCNAVEEGRDWTDVYYGPNYGRLQELRSKYDPLNIYSKPQLPEPATVCTPEEGPDPDEDLGGQALGIIDNMVGLMTDMVGVLPQMLDLMTDIVTGRRRPFGW